MAPTPRTAATAVPAIAPEPFEIAFAKIDMPNYPKEFVKSFQPWTDA
jgi:hypothetical protein